MNINPSEFELLVVDDIPSNVMLMKAILNREHYNVVTATNGKDAIEIIKNKCPDLILLDVMMPQMSGFEVCEYIRKDLGLSDVPIVLLTALNGTDDIVKGFSYGANDFISKPFNNEVLLMRIQFQLSIVASHRLVLKQTADLEAMMASRDKMYSVIAHDLRSPIATSKMIMNYVVDKIEDFNIDRDIIDMLKTVNNIIEDSFTLFDNLLKWTKSQTGRLNYIPQEVDAFELVETSIDVSAVVANSKGITIKIIKPEKSVKFVADIDMMKVIFRNLLSNAIKFSNENSRIVIEVNILEDRVEYSIIDTGIGMDQESIDKILSGNVDFTKAGTKQESGSGLGLRLTREFIHRNGGELSVTSELGKGSVFSFYIPRKK